MKPSIHSLQVAAVVFGALCLSAAQAEPILRGKDINERNLVANIEPTRDRATVVLHKGPDHRVTQVRLRRT